MTQAQRDAARAGGCSTTGSFSALISGRVPGTEESRRVAGGFGEKYIRLAVDADIPEGASVSALYSSGPSQAGLSAESADPTAIPQDQPAARIRGTLTSDGIRPVRIPPAGAALTFYQENGPTLLRADRSCLFGGTVVTGSSGGGLTRSFSRPDYRTDPVGGEPAPVPQTGRIPQATAFEVHVFTPEAEIEFRERMLTEPGSEEPTRWVRELPIANLIELMSFYEVAEMEPYEVVAGVETYPLASFGVTRARVWETGSLR